MANWNKNYYPMDKIQKWIEDGKSQSEIARLLNVDMRLIHKLCKKHGLICQIKILKGKEHGSWKGGRLIDKDGYVLLYSPNHPHARKPRKKYVAEHRLVMEKKIGRYLLPNEVVHHKNRNKQDNRISNLELFQSNSEHLAYELKGKCPNWSEEGKLRLRIVSSSRVGIPFGSKLNVT